MMTYIHREFVELVIHGSIKLSLYGKHRKALKASLGRGNELGTQHTKVPRPRFRLNKGFAHNLADPVREY